MNRSRPIELTKSKGIALNAVSSDDDEVGESFESLAVLAKRINKVLNFHQTKPQVTKNFKRFKPKSQNKGCFKCGESGHMIKDCPTWKNIKSKEKQNKSKNDHKQALLASYGWGDLDEGCDDQSEEDEEEANICLSSHEDKPEKKSQECLFNG